MKYTGVKREGGKPDLALIPPGTMTKIAAVMSDVLTRTEPPPYFLGSWKSVRPAYRYTNALMRHLEHVLMGLERDPTSGLPPIWHLLTDAAFLAWFHERGHAIRPVDEYSGDENSGQETEDDGWITVFGIDEKPACTEVQDSDLARCG